MGSGKRRAKSRVGRAFERDVSSGECSSHGRAILRRSADPQTRRTEAKPSARRAEAACSRPGAATRRAGVKLRCPRLSDDAERAPRDPQPSSDESLRCNDDESGSHCLTGPGLRANPALQSRPGASRRVPYRPARHPSDRSSVRRRRGEQFRERGPRPALRALRARPDAGVASIPHV